MNILFLTDIILEPRNLTGDGVHKKIYSQIDAFKHYENNVFICHKLDFENYIFKGDDFSIVIPSKNKHHLYSKIVHTAKNYKINICFLRNIGGWEQIYITYLLRRGGIKILLEIPTYPYFGETQKSYTHIQNILRIIKYKLTSYSLGLFINRIITYSKDKRIWGVKTINISNGIDPSNLPLSRKKKSNSIRITAVACMAFWHGYDRLIEGTRIYIDSGLNTTQPILVRIVGGRDNNPEFHRLKKLVKLYNLENSIEMPGEKYGKALDEIYDDTDVCVGSLGRHRSGVTDMKALKNVEYASRGLPFCYSENNSDFDKASYIFKIPADETPVDIVKLIQFVRNCPFSPSEIRNSMPDLSWKTQLKPVMDFISNC